MKPATHGKIADGYLSGSKFVKGLSGKLDISKETKLGKIVEFDILNQFPFKLDGKAICRLSNLGPLKLNIGRKSVIAGRKKPADFVILGILLRLPN